LREDNEEISPVSLDTGAPPSARVRRKGPDPAVVPPHRFGLTAQSLLLAGILGVLLFHTLQIARPLFLPIALAILASFALTPIVRPIVRWGVPSAVAAALVVSVVVLVGGAGVYALSGPAADWIGRAPAKLREAERKLRPIRAPVERIAEATREVEKATDIEDDAKNPVVVTDERSLFSDLVLQTQGVLVTLVATLVLLFFLLATGEGLAGALAVLPPWAADPGSARALVEAIEADVSRHLLTITLINAGLGVAVAASLALLGVPNPALWGVMAAVLNFVPFVGAVLGTLVVAGVALISFDEPGRAVLAAATFALLTGVEGLVITPAALGQRLTLSPVAVFTSLLLWSFLWGVPGALIAVPVLAVVKIVADRIPALRSLARMLASAKARPPIEPAEPAGSAGPGAIRRDQYEKELL
jgi:predicted PurR-regulated permease PerM